MARRSLSDCLAKSKATILIVLSFFGSSQLVRAQSGCTMDIYAYVVHPDNSQVLIGTAFPGAGDYPAYSANLAAGDSILVQYVFNLGIHPCEAEGLIVREDSASIPGPIIFDVDCGPTGMRFAQTGTFDIYGFGNIIDGTGHLVLTVTSDESTGLSGISSSPISVASINGSLEINGVSGGELEVRNIAGQLILKKSLLSANGTQRIPFSDEPAGIYIMTLVNGKEIHRGRFVQN